MKKVLAKNLNVYISTTIIGCFQATKEYVIYLSRVWPDMNERHIPEGPQNYLYSTWTMLIWNDLSYERQWTNQVLLWGLGIV